MITHEYLINFATWYSGMSRDKVQRAYERFLREADPKAPGAVNGNEAEKEDITNEDFCPECNIGLNNREVSLCFCSNCKAHW